MTEIDARALLARIPRISIPRELIRLPKLVNDWVLSYADPEYTELDRQLVQTSYLGTWEATARVCAMAVWLWDRGHTGELDPFELVVSRALRDGVQLPPAFVRIHDAIRAGRRAVPKKRIAKLKVDPTNMLQAVVWVDGIRRTAEAIQHDSGQAFQRREEAHQTVARARKFKCDCLNRLAAETGLSLPVLERTERGFRRLLADMAKK